MTAPSPSENIQPADAVWIPLGFTLGTALGAFLNDTTLGMSLGLLAGATVSTAIEYQHGKRSVIWPIVGGFAFIWIVALFVIERT